MIVYLTVCCLEERDLPRQFAHVLSCPIKISVLFNLFCVWLCYFIGSVVTLILETAKGITLAGTWRQLQI